MKKFEQLEKDGYVVKLTKEDPSSDDITYTVKAFDKEGSQVGEYTFKQFLPSDEPRHEAAYTLISIDADTEENHRRKGLATKAYCFIENYTGLILENKGRLRTRTDDGEAFWNQPNRPFG